MQNYRYIKSLEKFIQENDGFKCQECGFNQNWEEVALIKILSNYKEVLSRIEGKIAAYEDYVKIERKSMDHTMLFEIHNFIDYLYYLRSILK